MEDRRGEDGWRTEEEGDEADAGHERKRGHGGAAPSCLGILQPGHPPALRRRRHPLPGRQKGRTGHHLAILHHQQQDADQSKTP